MERQRRAHAPRAPRHAALGAAMAGMALGLAGCPTSGPIDESDRATDGAFDGAYAMSLEGRDRGFQNVSTWRMSCATGGFELPIRVEDGRARMDVSRFNGAKDPTAPITSVVDERGRFRFEVPIEHEAKAGGTSASTLDNGRMTLIYTGTLSAEGPSKGRYTAGIAEFGNQGCSYPVAIEPVGANA